MKERGIEPNSWKLRFFTMFHMSNDSSLFKTASELNELGFARQGMTWVSLDNEAYVRLYEAKMVHLYNHRHGDFSAVDDAKRSHVLPQAPASLLANADYAVESFYWVPHVEVERRLSESGWTRGWLMG
jgi:hypothetical protein